MYDKIIEVIDSAKNAEFDTDVYAMQIMAIIENGNHLARVEQAVKDGITHDTRIIAVQEWEINERAGYWERIYIVAWANEHESGTHRVHIDSEGKGALFVGEYLRSEAATRGAFYERVGR